MNSSRFMKLLIVGMVLLVAGCRASGEPPFLFSYEFNSIEPEHEELIDDWLAEAKAESETRIHSYEMEEFRYSYVRGYKDVKISFIYESGEGSLKQRFIKGSDQDEVFVKINFNPTVCCNRSVYETDDAEAEGAAAEE
ncbi:hypothetical protein M5W83_25150 [Paenibacillus thiaminolyticus]|uniref:Uncharacterized protein n=1 Tax=Paenibacillus thiaminolyticus TaxID=49283 RepID=A0AAP9IZM1_PANTH|nr:hypothetical protein [Paenibacillus thiaminolyticus]MCY9538096.1 hypothetical protein [Paenibacillus thiaminolyticus]MCY9605517.1 hypothetical protein [Paenibacillus thiaminolyticus]MCY9610443.1 hypothetical protein [Paenibacillus thiaminolyticus]MCY9612856.1 hypothetical protein [Paenibacillus thiaminolyticus]MCY9621559.1 hypothetical protein [Paenibacillus thiaminolyticus]